MKPIYRHSDGHKQSIKVNHSQRDLSPSRDQPGPNVGTMTATVTATSPHTGPTRPAQAASIGEVRPADLHPSQN
jgi:hypothetical protein